MVHANLSIERKGKMQATKDATASMKESAANAMASAKAGMDKTKATAREKVCQSTVLMALIRWTTP